MSLIRAILLFIVGCAVLGLAVMSASVAPPPSAQTQAAGSLMFPGLAAHLSDAARLEVTAKGATTTLDRDGETWRLRDRDGYPARPQAVRELLTGLTELRLIEPRTSDPALLARLGLDDPSKADAAGTLVRVLDAKGAPIAALVVGHRRVRSQGDLPESVYVRRPDSGESWLADGRVPLESEPAGWLYRDVVDIGHARVKSIAMTNPAGAITLESQDGKLMMTTPSDHPPLDEVRVEETGRSLEGLTFEDVRKSADPMPGTDAGTAVVTTEDGQVLTARVSHQGDDWWVRFAMSGTDADALAHRIDGWDYKLPSYKAKALVPGMADLRSNVAQPTPVPPEPPTSRPPASALDAAPAPDAAPVPSQP